MQIDNSEFRLCEIALKAMNICISISIFRGSLSTIDMNIKLATVLLLSVVCSGELRFLLNQHRLKLCKIFLSSRWRLALQGATWSVLLVAFQSSVCWKETKSHQHQPISNRASQERNPIDPQKWRHLPNFSHIRQQWSRICLDPHLCYWSSANNLRWTSGKRFLHFFQPSLPLESRACNQFEVIRSWNAFGVLQLQIRIVCQSCDAGRWTRSSGFPLLRKYLLNVWWLVEGDRMWLQIPSIKKIKFFDVVRPFLQPTSKIREPGSSFVQTENMSTFTLDFIIDGREDFNVWSYGGSLTSPCESQLLFSNLKFKLFFDFLPSACDEAVTWMVSGEKIKSRLWMNQILFPLRLSKSRLWLIHLRLNSWKNSWTSMARSS